jgi:ornithine decarboxylase
VGSGCKNPRLFRTAIQKAVEGCAILQSEGHNSNQIIDIGGGFSPDAAPFQAAAAEIRVAMQSAPPALQWIAEPGRFFAAPSQDFFVRVIGKKPSAAGSAAGWRYTLDDSLYGQFSCIPFDQARPQWVRVRDPAEAPRRRSRGILYGRTCDSVDLIAAAQDMEELEVGDWLWFPHMGAYTTVTATEFNGFPRPHVHLIESHTPVQLPPFTQVSPDDLPSGVQYVSPVKTPTLE